MAVRYWDIPSLEAQIVLGLKLIRDHIDHDSKVSHERMYWGSICETGSDLSHPTILLALRIELSQANLQTAFSNL